MSLTGDRRDISNLWLENLAGRDPLMNPGENYSVFHPNYSKYFVNT